MGLLGNNSGYTDNGLLQGITNGLKLGLDINRTLSEQRRADAQDALTQQKAQWMKEDRAKQQEMLQFYEDQKQIKGFYIALRAGMNPTFTPALQAAFKRNPLADIRHLAKPPVRESVDYAARLGNGEGDFWSPETPMRMNDFFEPFVQQGTGGTKRISAIYPGMNFDGSINPDRIVFELGVKGPDGTETFHPMTKGRGTAAEGDNEVGQYSVNEMITKAKSAQEIYKEFGPQIDAFGEGMGYVPRQAQFGLANLPDSTLVQVSPQTNEMGVLSRPQSARRGGGKRRAAVSAAQATAHSKQDAPPINTTPTAAQTQQPQPGLQLPQPAGQNPQEPPSQPPQNPEFDTMRRNDFGI